MVIKFWTSRGPLIIPTEARSEFPKIQRLMSGHILIILGPLVSRWVIWDSLFGGFWCPDGDQASGFLKVDLSGW